LLLAPEAVVHPSFQMSFAATLALVAGYQQGLPWMSKGGDTPLVAKIALWGGREIAARLAARRHRDHPIRRLSLSSHISLWRDRESDGDTGGVGLGHAGGDSWPDKYTAWLRRPVVAVDGAGHRLDDLRCAVGHEFSRSAGPDGGVRHRPAAAVHRWARC